jgi:DNA-binding MarR family transcriptional regulator
MKLELSVLELRLLRELCLKEYKNIGELAKALRKSPTRVSIALKDLENKGFVEKKKVGISKKVVLSSNRHAVSFKTLLNQYPHIRFERLLSGSALEILLPLAFYHKMKLKDIARLSGCSEVTVRRAIKRLKEFGLVVGDRSFFYSIGSFYFWLAEFVRDFQDFINLRLALSFSSTSVVLWRWGTEFLIKTREEKKQENFFPTCYEKMSDYGIQLILTEYRYYLHSPFRRKLRVEDIALHTLFLEQTPRNLLYVLLLIAKNLGKIRWEYLEAESVKFKMEDVIQDMKKYLETRGTYRPKGFPGWGKFEAKAREYEICLK